MIKLTEKNVQEGDVLCIDKNMNCTARVGEVIGNIGVYMHFEINGKESRVPYMFDELISRKAIIINR